MQIQAMSNVPKIKAIEEVFMTYKWKGYEKTRGVFDLTDKGIKIAFPLARSVLNEITYYIPVETFNSISYSMESEILHINGAVVAQDKNKNIIAVATSQDVNLSQASARYIIEGIADMNLNVENPFIKERGSKYITADNTPKHILRSMGYSIA